MCKATCGGWEITYHFATFPAFVNVISTLPQAAEHIFCAKRRLASDNLHIILLLSCVCECNIHFATSRRTLFCAKRRLKAGKLHIILLLSCVCECNFRPALNRRTLFLCKAACSGWQITYHFATFLRLRM